jgi:hypothetical protein
MSNDNIYEALQNPLRKIVNELVILHSRLTLLQAKIQGNKRLKQ